MAQASDITLLTDEILLGRVRQEDDMQAYRVIFDRHYTALTTFATKLVADIDIATDVVQNVFVNLYEKRRETLVTNVRSFLYSAVRNGCLNVIKHEKIKRQYENQVDASVFDYSSDAADKLIEQSEAEARVAGALAQLPEACRRVFLMSRFDGLSNQQIADALDISKRTVETQITNALKILRRLLLSFVAIVSTLLKITI